jgi:ketosteroid isomerase-like protein
VSRENVEFVEGFLGGAAAMDKQAILAVLPELVAQTCAPDIEWVEDPQRADGRIYRGHEGVQESFERWLEQWDEYGGEAERFIDCGDDVLVIAHERARGRISGAPVSTRIYLVFTICTDKITRYQEFYDERAALKAVGLEE